MTDLPWRPTATLEVLRARAAFLDAIRGFFKERGVLEVETPLLGTSTALDPYLASISASYHDAPGVPGRTLYLQTSPEYAMKRLLAAGSGPIFQICRTFRDGERGRRHNPEFTMLEWYRPGFSLNQLMDEVAGLVREVAGIEAGQRLTYREAFLRYAGLDPFRADTAELRRRAEHLSGLSDEAMTRDEALDIILSHQIEPELGCAGGTFLYHYPPSQAALARTREDDGVRVAERFELYVAGVEIANGYHELTDAAEQRRRFQDDNRRRQELGLPQIPLDENFLAALESGMPACSGVALGVDRLLMIRLGLDDIAQVLSFPLERV